MPQITFRSRDVAEVRDIKQYHEQQHESSLQNNYTDIGWKRSPMSLTIPRQPKE